MDVQSYNLGHLGIVAGIFDALKIDEVMDKVLPKQGLKNLPHSIEDSEKPFKLTK